MAKWDPPAGHFFDNDMHSQSGHILRLRSQERHKVTGLESVIYHMLAIGDRENTHYANGYFSCDLRRSLRYHSGRWYSYESYDGNSWESHFGVRLGNRRENTKKNIIWWKRCLYFVEGLQVLRTVHATTRYLGLCVLNSQRTAVIKCKPCARKHYDWTASRGPSEFWQAPPLRPSKWSCLFCWATLRCMKLGRRKPSLIIT